MGAAIALAACASLRGTEVFLLNLAGLWNYINIGRNGVIPPNLLKTGADLSNALHVVAPLIGEFKGELGTKHHLLALANCGGAISGRAPIRTQRSF